jgi:hypothetical protein
MLSIIIASVIVFGGIVILLYFIGKEIRIREMPGLSIDWNFTMAKEHEHNTILLTGNN